MLMIKLIKLGLPHAKHMLSPWSALSRPKHLCFFSELCLVVWDEMRQRTGIPLCLSGIRSNKDACSLAPL